MCAPPGGIIGNSSVTAKLLNKLTSQFICVNTPCLETQVIRTLTNIHGVRSATFSVELDSINSYKLWIII